MGLQAFPGPEKRTYLFEAYGVYEVHVMGMKVFSAFFGLMNVGIKVDRNPNLKKKNVNPKP